MVAKLPRENSTVLFSVFVKSKSPRPSGIAEDVGSSAAINRFISAWTQSFSRPQKAHPAFAPAGLIVQRQTLQARGIRIIEDDSLPGASRFYSEGPWGNRLEFLVSAS